MLQTEQVLGCTGFETWWLSNGHIIIFMFTINHAEFVDDIYVPNHAQKHIHEIGEEKKKTHLGTNWREKEVQETRSTQTHTPVRLGGGGGQ
jgi:hypothetical protein